MAATEVQKPDHAAPRRHFIFTEDHEALRESIHSFVIKELAPHAEAWEETTFPDSVFPRMGELGFLGLSMPEQYGGQGGDYFCNLVLAEALPLGQWRALDGHRGAHRHGHAADPAVRHRGAEAGVPGAGDPGPEDRLPRHHRARRRLRRQGHPDARRARRRRVGDQRLEDVHHQRPPRGLHRARDQDRPGRGLRRLHAVHRRHERRGRDPREEAREARDARERHRAARLQRRARARHRGAWASSARASTTSCGSSRASG